MEQVQGNVLEQIENNNRETDQDIKYPQIVLPFKGYQGNQIINRLRNILNKSLPNTVRPRFTYQGKKIGSFLSIKDKIKMEHQSDLVYGYTMNREIRDDEEKDYIGETNVRYETRTKEHTSQLQSSIKKDAIVNNYNVLDTDFEIIDKGYSKKVDRKIAEAILVKQYKPRLNEQKISLKLQLFN